MENATKALLIAAGVLIVILIIAMGMRIFNSTTGTADNVKTTMNATEIATFNNKFTAYAGKKSLSQVKALADIVIAHNAINETKQVSFMEKTAAEDITTAVSALTGGMYNIGFTYDKGLIKTITVTN